MLLVNILGDTFPNEQILYWMLRLFTNTVLGATVAREIESNDVFYLAEEFCLAAAPA